MSRVLDRPRRHARAGVKSASSALPNQRDPRKVARLLEFFRQRGSVEGQARKAAAFAKVQPQMAADFALRA